MVAEHVCFEQAGHQLSALQNIGGLAHYLHTHVKHTMHAIWFSANIWHPLATTALV